MLNGPIPPHVDPRKLADRGASLQGSLPLSRFERLSAQLVDTVGDVHASFTFERDELGAPLMRGVLETEVRMICQRCLDVAALPIHGEYTYVVVWPGSEQSVPKAYDTLEVGEEPLDLLTLVEDELLLALPIVPVHDPEDCQQPAGLDEPEPSEDEVKRSNPFSVLAQLKRDPNG
ncbi:YceD family protein [Pseudomonas sp. Marseille-QA0892]